MKETAKRGHTSSKVLRLKAARPQMSENTSIKSNLRKMY
jgi:hypothetical protein